MMFGSIPQNAWYEVQCAHCGAVYEGQSQTQTWAAAKACADSHQEKTYRYAPELKPNTAVETGTDPDA